MNNMLVDLIIPDSGPLISLAHADRLDLLDVFDRPVLIPDVVRLECLKKPAASDYPIFTALVREERQPHHCLGYADARAVPGGA